MPEAGKRLADVKASYSSLQVYWVGIVEFVSKWFVGQRRAKGTHGPNYTTSVSWTFVTIGSPSSVITMDGCT